MPGHTFRPRERDALIQSLRAGVTPRLGARHIQVGRDAEITALGQDIDRIAAGGATFRLVIGEYGSGKTFLFNLIRSEALERQLVTAHADLNPSRRLQASGGEARSLYAERKPEDIIHERLEQLSELVMGYDFATVIAAYWRAYETDDEALKASAIRWLRGEFSAKTDARRALGVREIIGDAVIYDQIKLLACFVRLAGYGGLLICLDELVNLYKLANPQARNGNYEQILRMLNDLEQGNTESLGFLLGGTPEFLTDPRRGLYSYPALQSRLAENPFARNGLVDLSGPVLHLKNLSREQFVALLGKLRDLYRNAHTEGELLPDEGIPAFMAHCEQRLGEVAFRTPRTTIKAFVGLLAVLEQNVAADWRVLLERTKLYAEQPAADFEVGNALTSLTL